MCELETSRNARSAGSGSLRSFSSLWSVCRPPAPSGLFWRVFMSVLDRVTLLGMLLLSSAMACAVANLLIAAVFMALSGIGSLSAGAVELIVMSAAWPISLSGGLVFDVLRVFGACVLWISCELFFYLNSRSDHESADVMATVIFTFWTTVAVLLCGLQFVGGV